MRKILIILKRIIELILSLPKSLFVCLHFFSIGQSLRFPILVRYNTRIISLKGRIRLTGRGKIKIGFGKISEFDKKYERSIISLNGDIKIETPCTFGQGCRIISEKGSCLEIGKRFSNTAKLIISNRGHITIGSGCLVSWNTWICDTDFHKVVDVETGKVSNPNGEVVIGNNVWMAANSQVMKGAQIPDWCIVATGSLVRSAFTESNCLLAGSPAKVKRQKVTWMK